MEFDRTRLPEVILIRPRVFGDDRGFFLETFRESMLAELGLSKRFVQDNHSRSRRGTLRGLHLQLQQAQGKLVRVTRGEIFDVAVDVRRDSPRFGQWFGTVLNDENHHQLFVPAGFAHGFVVTSDVCDVIYKCTDYYAPQHERTLLWNDPGVGVEWPLGDEPPLLSDKDREGVPLDQLECYATTPD